MRVNGLGNRPVLLRLGSNEYQARLGSYLTSMLSGAATKDDEASYEEGLERHRQLARRMGLLDEVQVRTLAARNLVDQLDAQADDCRALFGVKRFNALDGSRMQGADSVADRYVQAINALDLAGKGAIARVWGRMFRANKVSGLAKAVAAMSPI